MTTPSEPTTLPALTEWVRDRPGNGERGKEIDEIAAQLERMATTHVLIPMPALLPFGIPLDKRSAVQEVWDTFVKPDQEAEVPQSIEMRMLMAFLRSLYAALPDDITPATAVDATPAGS